VHKALGSILRISKINKEIKKARKKERKREREKENRARPSS
jgi:hypothetical protein